MKVRKWLWPVVLLCLALTACDEKTPEGEGGDAAAPAADKDKAAAPAAAPTPPPPKEVTPTAADICGNLVAGAKAKDAGKVLGVSTQPTGQALGAEGAKDYLMGLLGTATCGAARVDGDKATVPLTTSAGGKDATFIKAPDGWKFDGAAFLAANPPPAPDKHAKGKAAPKAKAAKAKKGKHHKK